MVESKGLHEGHRARIIEKFLVNSEGFSDHELLEIYLFQYIPRKNTNDIAHRLINTFGCLEGVITADVKALMTVDGVGKKTAIGLNLLGKITERVHGSFKPNLLEYFSYGRSREDLITYFMGLRIERSIVLLLNNKHKPLAQLTFDSNSHNTSFFNKQELVNALALHRPNFVIIAHNHPSGIAFPSEADDQATIQINGICTLLGTQLIDHIIVADERTYSYHYNDRLEKLLEKYNPLNGIEE